MESIVALLILSTVALSAAVEIKDLRLERQFNADGTVGEVDYLDSSYDYLDTGVQMLRFSVSEGTARKALVYLEEDDETYCEFDVREGTQKCRGLLENDTFMVNAEDGEATLTFAETPDLALASDWGVEVEDEDGDEDDMSVTPLGYLKCTEWDLGAGLTGEDGCSIEYDASCLDALFPEPYSAVVGLYSTYTGDWIEGTVEDLKVDENGDGTFSASADSPSAYDVSDHVDAPKGILARLVVTHGADGDAEDTDEGDEAVLDYVDLTHPFENFDTIGCPSFEDFCKDPTSETLPSLPSGAEKMDLETISCEQTGKTVPADQDVCRPFDILPEGEDEVTLEIACIAACTLSYDIDNPPEKLPPKKLRCKSDSVGWEVVEDDDVPRSKWPECDCDSTTDPSVPTAGAAALAAATALAGASAGAVFSAWSTL